MTSIRDEGRHWLAEELLWEQTLARLRSEAEGRVVPVAPDQPVDDRAAGDPEQEHGPLDRRPARIPAIGHRVA